jgi:CelD/BcsL family acetyltransferase involved in cellulose biosynthesis
VAGALRRHLDQRGWDEFVMNGCRRSSAIEALRAEFSGCAEQLNTIPSNYVDLGAIRKSKAPFEMSLSYNTRYKIRESIKLYQQGGELSLRRAESETEAGAMLQELTRLHQDRWTKKGRTGAFASPRFRSFHERVIARSFAQKQVDIVQVSAGDEAIGVIYSFAADGKAYLYQCGFRFSDNKKHRPGLVTLQQALQWYADAGLPEFDLMAGHQEYKRSLAKTSRPLDWLTVRRHSWRNTLVDSLRDYRERLRAVLTKPAPAQINENSGKTTETASDVQ